MSSSPVEDLVKQLQQAGKSIRREYDQAGRWYEENKDELARKRDGVIRRVREEAADLKRVQERFNREMENGFQEPERPSKNRKKEKQARTQEKREKKKQKKAAGRQETGRKVDRAVEERRQSKPTGEDSVRRRSSITRRLRWLWIRNQMLHYLVMDILFYCCGVMGSLFCMEYAATGEMPWRNTQRMFYFEREAEHLVYQVLGQEGEILLEVALGKILQTLSIMVLVIVGFQLLSLCFSFAKNEGHIRQILEPINELALRADKLSRMSFSEDKYQVIEEAISHIQPGEEESPLSFGDSDLSGIEAAMNNLIIRMQETYRQEARFVNDASHELRTPIAVIQGYVNLLDRWGKTDEKILEESIEAIKNESDHMNHLVEQLLFLARGDSGRTVLTKEEVSLGSLMEEIYEESLLIDENHTYHLRKGQDMVVEADLGLLKQAVRILVDNAVKYTKPGEDIYLSYGENPEGKPYLQVQDTGIGMDEKDAGHMFERFYRSDEVRSYSGTGLGLSIAKWIIDRHQGHFEILSRTTLGTRIRIVLAEGRRAEAA